MNTLVKTDLNIETSRGSQLVTLWYVSEGRKYEIDLTPDQCLELTERLLLAAGEAF